MFLENVFSYRFSISVFMLTMKVGLMRKMVEIRRELIGNYNDLKELRSLTYDFLVKNYSTEAVINHHTSLKIEFNSTSFRKLVSGTAVEIRFLALYVIRGIIEYGQLIEIECDYKERREILAVYKFKSLVRDGENTYEYHFTVRQTLSGKFIYSGHIFIKKITL